MDQGGQPHHETGDADARPSPAPTPAAASSPALRPWRWLPWMLIIGLLGAAAGALALALIDSEQLHRMIVRSGRDPEGSMFADDAVAGIQRRAVWAAAGYGLAAALVGLLWNRVMRLSRAPLAPPAPRDDVGPNPEAGVPMQCARLDWALVAVMTSASAALAALHLDQTLRLDEVSTFFNYGLRSPIVSLVVYHNVNNHILHSLLMLGSVTAFGDAEWAIRLPAMLAGVASVPLMYVVGRLHFDRPTALLAAGALAGSAYLVELATNARGYSMVNLAALLALATLPAMLRYRPWAWLVFIVASALGAWATPTMIYPFAAAGVWLGLAGLDRRAPVRARLWWWRDVALAAGATGALVLLLYSPALVVTGFGDMGTTQVAQKASSISEGQRTSQLAAQLIKAWEQWTWPAPHALALATLALVVAGWVFALIRGGMARWLAIGAVLGPGAVTLVMGGITPWWWSLGYLFLFYVLLGAAAIGAVVLWMKRARARIRAWAPPAAGLAALAGAAALTIASAYPHEFPHYHGYHDAAAAAEILDEAGLEGLQFAGTGMTRIPIEYYLYRRGYPERALDPLGAGASPQRLATVIRRGVDDPSPPFDGMTVRQRHKLAHSDLLLLESVRGADSEGSGEAAREGAAPP